jgi:serine/threonine protein kinase
MGNSKELEYQNEGFCVDSTPPALTTELSTISFFENPFGEKLVKKYSMPDLIHTECETLRALDDVAHIPKVVDASENHLVLQCFRPFPLKLSLLKIREHLKTLATTLAAIHARGYAHLDVSPGNIMLDNDDVLVLIDFQLARKVGNPIPAGCGTPGYIAPEIFQKTDNGCMADIYSCGVILGQLLEPYLENVNLEVLGSKLVTHHTTTTICEKIEDMEIFSNWSPIIRMAAGLLKKMLVSDPNSRITAQEILQHPFLNADDSLFQGYDNSNSPIPILRSSSKRSLDSIEIYR